MARVDGGAVTAVVGRPFEIQRDPNALVPLLREMLAEAGIADAVPHAVTMTAELSQLFRTKREGVRFVLDSIEAAFPGASVHVYTVDGRFLTPADAREHPLSVAAANWAATARAVAVHHPDALLVDIGTTTTDLVPIVGGEVVAVGHTDPERLMSAELLYTGAVRTPAKRSPVTFRSVMDSRECRPKASRSQAMFTCGEAIFVPPTTRVRLRTGDPPRATSSASDSRASSAPIARRRPNGDYSRGPGARAGADRSIRSAMQRVLEPISHSRRGCGRAGAFRRRRGSRARSRGRVALESTGRGGCSLCTVGCGCLTARRPTPGGPVVAHDVSTNRFLPAAMSAGRVL